MELSHLTKHGKKILILELFATFLHKMVIHKSSNLISILIEYSCTLFRDGLAQLHLLLALDHHH